MSLSVGIWVITVLVCLLFVGISLKVKGEATASFANYAIAGGTLPLVFIFFTDFATIMGVGNFVGHTGKGYTEGLSWLSFILGEQGSKIIFGLVFAGFAGKFTYNTVAEMSDDLFFRDKWTRALVGFLSSIIMISWVAGQVKGFGNVFNVVTGVDPLPIIIFFSVIFITYTALGGMYSVIWIDLFQGGIVLVLASVFYYITFTNIDFSLAVLGQKLAAVGKGDLFSFSKVNPVIMVTNFVTASVGILAAQIYWQRCFAAKSGSIARRGIVISGCLALLFCCLSALTGMTILTLQPGLATDNVIPWYMNNHLPVWLGTIIFALMLVAGMSAADANLNSATVLIVNDLIRPFRPELNDAQLVKLATWLTVVVGIFACVVAMQASTIMGLFAKAYGMVGSGLVPLIILGLLWKERSGEAHEMGKKNSKITPWGARLGIISGVILSQITELGPNRVLIAITINFVVIYVVSLLTQDRSASTPQSVTK
ncbi:sodium:solute symporter [Anaerosporomusa subterranea]|uniref:Sodium:solute symporter n=1 Tax=Anaerosporomusa subterranea TaxID=1794912 RepID=A0A154BQE7_ANASB|nr:sodium:solute symporter family protein [Anaerosporomusa subterranea]KYZ76090.1 sodium:solute symporter [Anaerosporomusa subterranea]